MGEILTLVKKKTFNVDY